jgi:hypothetical protein
MMKVKNVGSNMTELVLGDVVVLFSYETPVAASTESGYIKTDEKYSSTTTKHVNKWLEGVNAKIVPQATINSLVS